MDDHRWAELERRGFSHREANRLLELGTLTKIRYGVYGEPADLDVLERHRRLIDATWLIIRSGAVLSHFSAAAVHGLPIPATDLNRVWITRPGTSGKTTRWLHLARAELSEAEVCEIDGRLVTSLARTVVDVARRLDLLDGLPLVDAALRAGADRQVLADLLEVEGRRRGNQALRTAVALADPLAESVGESRSRALMWTLGLPMPVLQHPLSDDDGFIGRVDFYWPAHRLVGEFDGKVKYGRTLEPDQDPGETVWKEKLREDRIRRTKKLGVERWVWANLFQPRLFDRRLRTTLGLN